MELATNQFTKGLQIDTHPMVQGNETLSDCLNGTLVTMNGNEVVLLNDMGNRRVDNAFLPAGYEPVGMKEYGGIIYIAAYNPITNKSQIGSFPSPQLKYGKSDNLSADVDTTLFGQHFTDKLFGDIEFLKNFVILVPFIDSNNSELSEKVILHAGDKFTVYGGNLNKNLITNYNNVTINLDKLESPKNRTYTLALGVLNSQNEFVDFTESLLRWDANGKIIEFRENTPDYIKFNTGYFIPSTYTNPELDYTKQDLLFVLNRLKIDANTYAYKLVGPLYIKQELNVIDNLTYNIYGNFTDNNKTEIFIETIYEYNCPDCKDELKTYKDTGNDKYKNFLEIKKSNSSLFNLGSKIRINNSDVLGEKLIEDTKYDPETNLYRAIKAAKHIYDSKSGIITIMIVPLTSVGYGIRNLSYIESFDVSKLNSNEIELTDFRYYSNLNKQTTDITVGFKAYPKYRNSFKDLKISILDYKDPSNVIQTFEWGESGYNGIKTFTWNWLEDQKSHFYPVKITYIVENNNPLEEYSTESKTIYRWIMTTKLLNECYTSSKFVRDFGKVENGKFPDNIEECLIVKPIIISKVKEDETKDVIKFGDQSIYKMTNEDYSSEIATIYTEDIKLNGTIELDRDLYPLELILLESQINDKSVKILLDGETWSSSNKIFPGSYNNNEYKVNITIENLTKTGNNFELKYKGNFIGLESYKGSVKELSIVINKLFVPFYDYLENNLTPFATISVDSWDESTDEHAIYFSMLNPGDKKIDDMDNIAVASNPYENWYTINFGNIPVELDNRYNFYFGKEKDAINTGINSAIDDRWIFVGTNCNWIESYSKKFVEFENQNTMDAFTPPRPIMFWMKTLDGWAILPVLDWNTYVPQANQIDDEKNTSTPPSNPDYGEYWKLNTIIKEDTEDDVDDNEKLNPDGGDENYYKFWNTGSNGELTTNLKPRNLKHGWIGEPVNGKTGYLKTTEVLKYLKSRIINFYYVGLYNVPRDDVYGLNREVSHTKITFENNIITFQIILKILINELQEINSINYVRLNLLSRKSFFTKSNNSVECIGYSKDLKFSTTELFEDLVEYIKEQLRTNIIEVGLSEKSTNQLYLEDYIGNLLNPNILYYKLRNDSKFHPINTLVEYERNIPLIYPEHLYCGITWMYATKDSKYDTDNNDHTYLYMTGVPTIPRVLLKDKKKKTEQNIG